jgi:hypothetical protein
MELYDNLSDDGKRIVNAMIKTGTRPTAKPKQTRQKKSLTELVKPTIGGFADDTNTQKCASARCGKWPDDNIHHKQTMIGYHEFQPAGEVGKGAGA